MSSAQGWAVVIAVLSLNVDGVARGALAVVAILFLLLDDHRRRQLERKAGA